MTGASLTRLALGLVVAACALNPLAASPAAAQSSTRFVYCMANSITTRSAVFSPVFEWYGSGTPPLNMMNGEFTPRAANVIGTPSWVSCQYAPTEDRAEASRSNAMAGERAKGYGVETVPFTFG